MVDVIVLAGGEARRLGGVDKPALEIGGISLLDRVLGVAAEVGAESLVVVGPERPVAHQVVWTREDPPLGGPAAALAAGLRFGHADTVVLLAADLPFLDAAGIRVLLDSVGDADGALYVDDRGKRQPLAAAYRRASLAAAVANVAELDGARLWTIVESLSLHAVADVRGLTADCDTWERVETARRLLATSPGSDEDGPHGRHS